MSVTGVDSTANCNVEEAQEWIGGALQDALMIPNIRDAQVVISYLEEDGQLNVVSAQLDGSDGSWDCRSQAFAYAPEMDSAFGDEALAWGMKKFNHLADQMNQCIEDIVPLSERASEHDPEVKRVDEYEDD